MMSINPKDMEIRVSSVLNRDTKQYGKQFLFDGRDDTCWQSEGGPQGANNQWIECRFKQCFKLEEIHIVFQGGFAAKQITVQYLSPENDLLNESFLYANDKNDLQIFKHLPQISVNKIKLLFNDCSDFFGRIVVYKLELFSQNS